MKVCCSGEILVSVQHADNYLTVFINRARGLAEADQDRTPNPYVKISLLSDMTKYPKKKTDIKKKTRTPVYRESYKVRQILNTCTVSFFPWVAMVFSCLVTCMYSPACAYCRMSKVKQKKSY